MYVNHLELNGNTEFDLREDTVTPETLAVGATAHNAAGEPINGSLDVADIDALEAAALACLDGTAEGYKRGMRLWFILKGADALDDLTALCDEWYALTRPEWDGYTEFYQPDVSAVTTGTRGGDNAGMTCEPSTDTVAGQDDYAGNPLFAVVDCNFVVDADTLEPVITAIDGISSGFERDNPDKYVGVLQMSGWHWWEEGDDTYKHGYASKNDESRENIEPLPESVRVDGTVREWVIHTKYVSRTGDDGQLTSCAGAIPSGFMSHNTSQTAAKVNGAQYSGYSCVDDAFIFLMVYIKYASLTLDGIMQGTRSVLNLQKYAQVAEEGVRRIILTASDASGFEVGMSVFVGYHNGSSVDRGQAAVYEYSGKQGALITAIESVTIEVDGVETEYTAIYVDTEETFDTAANGSATEGTTLISTWLWPTGTTDKVLGNDGSPVSNTSGKYPYKLQGIELMNGAYEVVADSILSLYQGDDGETYYYEPYICDRTADQATSLTDNYKASGVILTQPESAGWRYIRKNGFGNGIFFPADAEGGSSSTYTRDQAYCNAATTGTREWLVRGHLSFAAAGAGLSCVYGYNALTTANWYIAARLSANGNRGEWA